MVTHSSNWLLDTNILSEACKPQPNVQVLELMDRYKLEVNTHDGACVDAGDTQYQIVMVKQN